MAKPRIGIPPYFNYQNDEEFMPEGYLRAVDRLADGLIIEATAEEGFPEAYRGTGRQWILGVQWHPEVSFKVDRNSRVVFSRFARVL